MRVSKWGKSLAVRLPASVVKALGLKEGDEVELHAARHLKRETGGNSSRDDLIAQLRTFRGTLPADFKFDRDEANLR
jgi:antitoxin MazE